MSVTLTTGANRPLNGGRVTVTLHFGASLLAEYAGVAWLPADEHRQLIGPAVLAHDAGTGWLGWRAVSDGLAAEVDFAAIDSRIERLLLAVYVYHSAGPLSPLQWVRLQIGDLAEHRVELAGVGDAAMLLLELYRRQGQWKVRALEESSAYGLAALGRRSGVSIDESAPGRPAADASAARATAPRYSGTGFAISEDCLLTCAHVIEGARSIAIRSLAGVHPVEPVVVDVRNDMALLRVADGVTLSHLDLRQGPGCWLAEPVTSMGYPLAGIAGRGIQVTQGNVSSLFGPGDDARLLQFTAPIQPGSSGSPLIDVEGMVAGMVVSSISEAQNMNYAVKSSLLISFLEAAALALRDVPRQREQRLDAREIIRRHQAALWSVEAVA